MKKDIHPKYSVNSKVSCACGAKFEVGSTLPSLSIEICSQCHPFYTGTEKVLDSAGRVEKFKTRLAQAQSKKPVKKAVKKNDVQKTQEKQEKVTKPVKAESLSALMQK